MCNYGKARCTFVIPYHKCTNSRRPEFEPSGSKHEEDIKIKG